MAKLNADFIAELENPAGVLISLDGKLVVYTLQLQWNRKHEHSTSSLWLADVGKPNSARQLTSGKFQDAAPRFSPDGEYISFISDRESRGKSSCIYLLPIAKGGEAIPLTPVTNQKCIGSHLWSPDGRYIAYTSADEQEDRGKDDAKTYGENLEHARLRIVDIYTEQIRILPANKHVANFAWSPDGESLVIAICKSPEIDHVRLGGAELRIIRIKDGTSQCACRFDGGIEALEWHEDELYWVAKQDNKLLQASMALWRASALDFSQQPRRAAYGEHNCARGIRSCGDQLVVYVQEGLSDSLECFGSSKVIFKDKLNISGGWDARFDGRKATVAVIKADIPSYAEVFTIIGDNVVQLSQHCTPPDHLAHTECITLKTKADDGVPVDGVMYIPQPLSSKSGPHPTVVVAHGGPYDRITQGRDATFSWTPWLLSLGYVVLHPNYRGGSGHGKNFAAATWGDPSESYQDIITLVKKCIADGIVDEKRVAISGWSQGGYLSYLAVTRDANFHFTTAIAGAGVSCWDTLAMSSDVPMLETALSGSAPWLSSSESTTSRHASPIWFMQNISTPVLILHGEEDARVPVEQAKGFHRGMLARGKTCEMVLYPREGHGFPKVFERAHYMHMLEKMRDFLESHLKE